MGLGNLRHIWLRQQKHSHRMNSRGGDPSPALLTHFLNLLGGFSCICRCRNSRFLPTCFGFQTSFQSMEQQNTSRRPAMKSGTAQKHPILNSLLSLKSAHVTVPIPLENHFPATGQTLLRPLLHNGPSRRVCTPKSTHVDFPSASRRAASSAAFSSA